MQQQPASLWPDILATAAGAPIDRLQEAMAACPAGDAELAQMLNQAASHSARKVPPPEPEPEGGEEGGCIIA
eukprot:SAG22_NODE_105_length_20045_cov_23.373308_12_plen_72_part_00